MNIVENGWSSQSLRTPSRWSSVTFTRASIFCANFVLAAVVADAVIDRVHRDVAHEEEDAEHVDIEIAQGGKCARK